MPATPKTALTWDWPHRLWHWLFAACICVSLYTGLDGGVGAMDVHITSGVAVIGLLLFRFGWALWGGRHVRVTQYRTSASAIYEHFRGAIDRRTAHSAPGAAMALAMFGIVFLQAATGLFSSDDIVTDGPFVHLANSAGVDLATAIHTRVYWVVLALVATHVCAVAWYAWRRDPVASSMLTGRTATTLPAIDRHHWIRATLTLFAAALIVWVGTRWA